MQWVTVASACRTQFGACPLVLKANQDLWCGRRHRWRGKTHSYDWAPLPSNGYPPPLSASGSSYLLVTHGSTLTESSWCRETLSIATKHVCPSTCVSPMHSAHGSMSRLVVDSREKQMANIVCWLLFLQRTYAVFSNRRMTESVTYTLQVLQNSRFPWHKA